MKKSLIALAVLGTLSGTAIAQSSVTLYGAVDAGITFDGDNITGGDERVGLDSGIQAGSRLGVRGTEDLGGGLSGIFALEMGLAADTGESTQGGSRLGADGNPQRFNRTFGRQAYVGLESNWGRLTFGRQYTPYYLALSGVADPFAGGLAGTAENLMWRSGTRMDNTIKYVLPEWGGFNAELAYSFEEETDNSDRGRAYSGSLGYATGPFAIKLAHHSLNSETDDIRERATLLAGTYDLNVAKLHLGLADNDNVLTGSSGGIRNADSRDLVTGASVPFGRSTFLVSYVRKDDRSASDLDADQWGVGYLYNISKRTNFYTSFAQISNDNGARYTVGNSMNVGTGEQQFNLGVRHTF